MIWIRFQTKSDSKSIRSHELNLKWNQVNSFTFNARILTFSLIESAAQIWWQLKTEIQKKNCLSITMTLLSKSSLVVLVLFSCQILSISGDPFASVKEILVPGQSSVYDVTFRDENSGRNGKKIHVDKLYGNLINPKIINIIPSRGGWVG